MTVNPPPAELLSWLIPLYKQSSSPDPDIPEVIKKMENLLQVSFLMPIDFIPIILANAAVLLD